MIFIICLLLSVSAYLFYTREEAEFKHKQELKKVRSKVTFL